MIKKYILAGLLILFLVSAFADGGIALVDKYDSNVFSYFIFRRF